MNYLIIAPMLPKANNCSHAPMLIIKGWSRKPVRRYPPYLLGGGINPVLALHGFTWKKLEHVHSIWKAGAYICTHNLVGISTNSLGTQIMKDHPPTISCSQSMPILEDNQYQSTIRGGNSQTHFVENKKS